MIHSILPCRAMGYRFYMIQYILSYRFYMISLVKRGERWTCMVKPGTDQSKHYNTFYRHYDAAMYSYVPLSCLLFFNTAIVGMYSKKTDKQMDLTCYGDTVSIKRKYALEKWLSAQSTESKIQTGSLGTDGKGLLRAYSC